jgi:predicted RNA methylase
MPADIVISETLGAFALEENIIENMREGKRVLKPKGTLIPGLKSKLNHNNLIIIR